MKGAGSGGGDGETEKSRGGKGIVLRGKLRSWDFNSGKEYDRYIYLPQFYIFCFLQRTARLEVMNVTEKGGKVPQTVRIDIRP